jgi:hypothetical protein
MTSLPSILSLAHLIGLALGAGAATVKLTLLFRCHAGHALVPVYVQVAKPITRQIVLGIILLTLSGIGWLLLVYPITMLLVLKLILVVTILALGPIIDNFVEPKFRKLAPAAGEAASPEFIRIQKQYLTLEAIATGLFYVIIMMWVLV